jgi:hypothetical protein
MSEKLPFGDKNLQKTVPQFYRTEKNMISVTGKLGEKAHTKFSCKDTDIGGYSINCFIAEKSYFDIMDAISAVRNFGWNRIQQYAYQLDDSLNEYEKVFERRSDFDKNRSEAAIPVMDFVDELSVKELEFLKSENGRGIPFQKFPQKIQKALREVAKIVEDEYPERKGLVDKLNSGTIGFDSMPSSGFKNMIISFNVSGGSYGIGVHNFEAWKSSRSEIGEKQTRMDYKKSKITISRWAGSSEGKKKVSFQGYASPEIILMDIARRYSVDIICDSKKMWKKSISISARNVPISEFMGILVDKLPKIEYEVRESGILVVRGPKNPYQLLRV